jgi:hypothetical protein
MTIATDIDLSTKTCPQPHESISKSALELLFKEAKRRQYHRRLRWFGLALAVLLTAGTVAGIALSAGGSSPLRHGATRPLAVGTDAKAWTCQGNEIVRPRNFVLSCADDNAQLTQTKWTSWSGSGAVGVTTFGLNLCKPYCAASKMSYFPNSRVTFSAPVNTSHGKLFSLVTVRYRLGGKVAKFQLSWQGDPSFK